jgi:hypothetical protein
MCGGTAVRLVGCTQSGILRSREPGKCGPLEADLVMIDETSMVDVIRASKLARAVAPGAHPRCIK